ncbi:MAG: RHS repeat-associated core domain-containing protein, partial [Gammaproteobacteria bacterium]
GIDWVTRWRHLDHLGSLRLMTDERGWVVSGSQIDYYPFGMPMDAVPPSSWLFTGHEKDATTGLDYMLARMHSASVGSFTSVDPARGSAKQVRPDSWNRYSYVRNNPMGRVDPTGGVPRPPGSGGVRPQVLPPTSGNHSSTLASEKEQDIQSFDGRDGQEQDSAEFFEQFKKGTYLLDGGPTAGNALGHVALAVDGIVYSALTSYVRSPKDGGDWGVSLKAYLQAQREKRVTTIMELRATAVQKDSLMKNLETLRADAATGGRLENSCVDITERALEGSGILRDQGLRFVHGEIVQVSPVRSVLPHDLSFRVRAQGLVERTVTYGRRPPYVLPRATVGSLYEESSHGD